MLAKFSRITNQKPKLLWWKWILPKKKQKKNLLTDARAAI